MSARIYRLDRHELVAEFDNVSEALLCLKGIAHALQCDVRMMSGSYGSDDQFQVPMPWDCHAKDNRWNEITYTRRIL